MESVATRFASGLEHSNASAHLSHALIFSKILESIFIEDNLGNRLFSLSLES